MDNLNSPFDLVFIDADKEGYPAYYEKALELLSPRGIIVMDNVLRGGRVLDSNESENRREPSADEIIKTLNAKIQADESVVNVILTVRDGLTLIRKADAQTN